MNYIRRYNIKDDCSEGGGRGLYAREDIIAAANAEDILVELPFFLHRVTDGNRTGEQIEDQFFEDQHADIVESDLQATYAQLGARDREKFDKLYNQDKENQPTYWRLRTNCFTLRKRHAAEFRVYSTISLINHSCQPNAILYLDTDYRNPARLRAVRDIPKGQEITIDYNNSIMAKELKQTYLKQNYGFDCTCALCASTSPQIQGLRNKLHHDLGVVEYRDWLDRKSKYNRQTINERVIDGTFTFTEHLTKLRLITTYLNDLGLKDDRLMDNWLMRTQLTKIRYERLGGSVFQKEHLECAEEARACSSIIYGEANEQVREEHVDNVEYVDSEDSEPDFNEYVPRIRLGSPLD